MSQTDAPIERSVLIFAIWAVLGLFGLCVFLEGMRTDWWALSSAGVFSIVLAFVAHIVVNGIFDTGFTQGEAALGIGAYGVLGLIFVVSAAGGDMTMADYYSGLTLFGVLAAGFLAYLFTRHGLRGAFSRFHMKPTDGSEAH